MRKFLILFLLLSSKAWCEIDCTDDQTWLNFEPQVNAITECQTQIQKFAQSCDEGALQSTMGQTLRLLTEQKCLKKFMNKELDLRLFKLKSKNKKQYELEMQIQKDFNDSMLGACDEFNSCGGTLNRLTRAQCQNSLITWRYYQAQQINAGQLHVDSQIMSKNNPKDHAIKNFAEGVCKMPSTVFKNQLYPKNCKVVISNDFVVHLGEDCHGSN